MEKPGGKGRHEVQCAMRRGVDGWEGEEEGREEEEDGKVLVCAGQEIS